MSDIGLLVRSTAPSGPVAKNTFWFNTAAGTLAVSDGTNFLTLGRVACVDDFGASTTASAATNTTAFDAAIASGSPVYVPPGTYDLNALTAITDSVHLFGAGRSTILRFNTTGDAIYLHPAAGDQGDTYHLHDLAFDNVTNTPASFIRNNLAVNVHLDRLYFSNCAATFCVDNESGYGLRMRDCVLSDVTGSGVRLQDDGVGATKYSYAAMLDQCDLTRLSGDGIVIDGTASLNVLGGVIESVTGKGIWTNYRAGAQIASVQSWGINLQGVYFESNGTDIKCETASDYSSRITMTACSMVDTPTIDLGTHGQLVVIGSQQGGGNVCTVSGSSEARVTLVSSSAHNFSQSGTFQWCNVGDFYDADSTPSWAATSSNPALENGTLTSRWHRFGSRATLNIALTTGSSTTYGTGTYVFGDSLMTTVPASAYAQEVGQALLYDATGAYEVGTVYMADNDSLYIACAGGLVSPTVPWTWASGDQIRLRITYRC